MSEIGQDQYQELYNRCLTHSRKHFQKANALKIINIVFNTLIVISSVVIASLSFLDPLTAQYVNVSLGLLITVIESLSSSFKLQKRAVSLYQIGIKIRELGYELQSMSHESHNRKDLDKTFRKIYKEFDRLDLSAFGNGTLERITHN